MQNKNVIIPPFFPDVEGKIIFLAGPIQGAAGWQERAIGYIQNLAPDIYIASPRRDNWDDKDFDYETQVKWETHYLNKAHQTGAIIFWLANEFEKIEGRAYAQTTRFELGEWKAKHEVHGTRLVVGIDTDFTNARYIRLRLKTDCPNVPVCETLEETCSSALSLIGV